MVRRIETILPYPPSVNSYYRSVGFRVLISREGRKYRKMVVSRLSGARPLEGRLSFTALLYPKDRRRRDVDNVLKSLLDSLAHAGTMHDDSQIKVLHVVMNEPDGEARVEVRMEELE